MSKVFEISGVKSFVVQNCGLFVPAKQSQQVFVPTTTLNDVWWGISRKKNPRYLRRGGGGGFCDEHHSSSLWNTWLNVCVRCLFKSVKFICVVGADVHRPVCINPSATQEDADGLMQTG